MSVFKVVVIYHKVVVLLHMVPQVEVLCKKSLELRRGSVIGQFSGMDILSFEHEVKEVFPMAASLHRLVDVEVKH